MVGRCMHAIRQGRLCKVELVSRDVQAAPCGPPATACTQGRVPSGPPGAPLQGQAPPRGPPQVPRHLAAGSRAAPRHARHMKLPTAPAPPHSPTKLQISLPSQSQMTHSKAPLRLACHRAAHLKAPQRCLAVKAASALSRWRGQRCQRMRPRRRRHQAHEFKVMAQVGPAQKAAQAPEIFLGI